MSATWCSAVRRDSESARAMSWVEAPSASGAPTCCSRWESSPP
ncbi:hypothetical protein [Kitasatospora terrestris]